MLSLERLRLHDPPLAEALARLFGRGESPYYDQGVLDELAELGAAAFYFNTLPHDSPRLPLKLPTDHQLGIATLVGRSTEASASLVLSTIYPALDRVSALPNGKLHFIFCVYQARVFPQALSPYRQFNRHPAMGLQVVLGGKSPGFVATLVFFAKHIVGNKRLELLRQTELQVGLSYLNIRLNGGNNGGRSGPAPPGAGDQGPDDHPGDANGETSLMLGRPW